MRFIGELAVTISLPVYIIETKPYSTVGSEETMEKILRIMLDDTGKFISPFPFQRMDR